MSLGWQHYSVHTIIVDTTGLFQNQGGMTGMYAFRPPRPACYSGPVQATDAVLVGKLGNSSQMLQGVIQSSF